MLDITFKDADIRSSTPAKCNHATGVIYKNVNKFYKFNKPQRVFILLHEIGHLICKTHSEITSDTWALKEFIKHGYSLHDAYTVLEGTLPGTNSEQRKRIQTQKIIVNQIAKKMNNYNIQSVRHRTPLARAKKETCNNCDSFLGFGKTARKRRLARIDRLKGESESKNEVRKMEAQAMLELAKKGISGWADKEERKSQRARDIVNSVANVAGAAMGGGSTELKRDRDPESAGGNDNSAGAVNNAPDAKKTFAQKYGVKIGLAVAGAALCIGAYMVITKKH